MGAVFCHISIQTNRNVNEKPLLNPSLSQFNIYLCNRSEKSKCPSQGNPRAYSAAHCMPDGRTLPPAPPSLSASTAYRE